MIQSALILLAEHAVSADRALYRFESQHSRAQSVTVFESEARSAVDEKIETVKLIDGGQNDERD